MGTRSHASAVLIQGRLDVEWCQLCGSIRQKEHRHWSKWKRPSCYKRKMERIHTKSRVLELDHSSHRIPEELFPKKLRKVMFHITEKTPKASYMVPLAQIATPDLLIINSYSSELEKECVDARIPCISLQQNDGFGMDDILALHHSMRHPMDLILTKEMSIGMGWKKLFSYLQDIEPPIPVLKLRK